MVFFNEFHILEIFEELLDLFDSVWGLLWIAINHLLGEWMNPCMKSQDAAGCTSPCPCLSEKKPAVLKKEHGWNLDPDGLLFNV